MSIKIIENGIVVNVILATLAEAENVFTEMVCVESDTGGIGWSWNGTEFIEPPAPLTPVPEVVDMAQARLALLGAGMLAAADAAIAAMAGSEGEAARIEWEFRTLVRRDSPLVAGTAAALSLTDEQLDALFTTAAGL